MEPWERAGMVRSAMSDVGVRALGRRLDCWMGPTRLDGDSERNCCAACCRGILSQVVHATSWRPHQRSAGIAFAGHQLLAADRGVLERVTSGHGLLHGLLPEMIAGSNIIDSISS